MADWWEQTPTRRAISRVGFALFIIGIWIWIVLTIAAILDGGGDGYTPWDERDPAVRFDDR